MLNKTGQAMWKKMKKITSMGFGYGGVILVPYVKGGKIYYNIVPQDRLTIDKTEGDLITGATVLAEKKEIVGTITTTVYYRWSNYEINDNNSLVITQQYTDEKGNKIPAPDFWKNIQEVTTITNVDRVPFGYIKSTVNNRKSNDKYGVPITYGCDKTIKEIKETMAQIVREYDLKQAFVGVDRTMFGKNETLPIKGLFQKLDTNEDNFFEVFDPAIRDSSYYVRLQELYQRLEHEVGTSKGILSEVETKNATATEIKRAMYDTFTIVDDMRSAIEKGLEDFFYACNVLANAFNLSAQGEYEITYDWDYSLIEDSQEAFSQLMQGLDKGIVKEEEVRMWLNPSETLEEAQKNIAEIKANNPTIESLVGISNE